MAGLAAVEIAQRVSRVWRSLQTDWKHSSKGTSKQGKRVRRKERLNLPSQNRGGAGCTTSSLFETSTPPSTLEDRSSRRPSMPWQTVYSLAVKWRQISEPCDPVVWINRVRYNILVNSSMSKSILHKPIRYMSHDLVVGDLYRYVSSLGMHKLSF